VLFARCAELVQRLPQELARLDRFDLLILEELSDVRRDQAATSVLFELICERYEPRAWPSPPTRLSPSGARYLSSPP